jgi:hypothetical protein
MKPRMSRASAPGAACYIPGMSSFNAFALLALLGALRVR